MEERAPPETKHCPSCNTTKLRTEFTKSSRYKDGLWWECRECKAKRAWLDYNGHKSERQRKNQRYKEDNRERIREADREYHRRIRDPFGAVGE